MIRTRFAPSPTGFLHIGGLKTALFAYLFAKKSDGKFILRIEDTDQNRYVEGGMEQIIWSLKWAGINYDEGPDVGGEYKPYIQSERREIYQKYINELLDKGFAYRCFCTNERLEEMRRKQEENKMPPKYDKHCLSLSKEEIDQKVANGEKYVIRMKAPDNEWIKFNDLIKGKIEFNTKELDDQVLIKSDGLPTYHFAVVVDDHLMNISHVIRADEWVSSTPKHILLYKYFDWKEPEYAHVPPILAPGGKKKLSKREGSVSVNEFVNLGYLPEGMINYLVLLGWNPGTTEEIFTMEELIEKFDLSKCQKAGAVFDIKRLEWVNGQHIRKMDTMIFRTKLMDYIIQDINKRANNESFIKFAIIEQERINKLSEYKQDFNIIYNFDESYDGELILNEKMGADKVSAELAFNESIKLIESIDFEKLNSEVIKTDNSKLIELKKSYEEFIKNKFLDLVKNLNMKNGQILWPVRYALTGTDKSPTIFELVWILGKEESVRRLNIGIKKIEVLG